MQHSMSTCIETLDQTDELGQDCEKTLQRDFHKRLAVSLVFLALGVIGVLTHVA